jgi:putative ATP-grasp target RiPP
VIFQRDRPHSGGRDWGLKKEIMVAIQQRQAEVFPAMALFPLGRRFSEQEVRAVEAGRVPFGVRLAVASRPSVVDLAQVGDDPIRQIGVIHDGGVLMPLLKHSTGQTRTNTASRDAGPSDSDTDYTED